MKPVKVESNGEYQSTEKNYGHTQNEWGISNNKKDSSVIYSYKMKWETTV